jgi:hypothetical protein
MTAGSWWEPLDTGLSTLDFFLTESWVTESFFRMGGVLLRGFCSGVSMTAEIAAVAASLRAPGRFGKIMDSKIIA